MLRHLSKCMFEDGNYIKSQMDPDDDPTIACIILMLILLAAHLMFG